MKKFPYSVRLMLVPAEVHHNPNGAGQLKIFKRLFLWIFPLFIAFIILPLIDPVFGQLSDRQSRLSLYLLNNNIPSGIEKGEGGFSQVYYEFEGEKVFVTSDAHPHGSIDTKGEYMTWISEIDGSWQVFLYHIPSATTLQLTRSGNHSNPRVDKGMVAWEGWHNGSWQVFLYDGKSIGPLTNAALALHPQIEGDFLVFSERSSIGIWSNYIFSIAENKKSELAVGEGEYVALLDGEISYGTSSSNKKVHPLMAGDIFTLGFADVPTSLDAEIVQVEAELSRLRQEAAQIPQVEEVQSATGSARLDPAVPTPTPTPAGVIPDATGSAGLEKI